MEKIKTFSDKPKLTKIFPTNKNNIKHVQEKGK